MCQLLTVPSGSFAVTTPTQTFTPWETLPRGPSLPQGRHPCLGAAGGLSARLAGTSESIDSAQFPGYLMPLPVVYIHACMHVHSVSFVCVMCRHVSSALWYLVCLSYHGWDFVQSLVLGSWEQCMDLGIPSMHFWHFSAVTCTLRSLAVSPTTWLSAWRGCASLCPHPCDCLDCSCVPHRPLAISTSEGYGVLGKNEGVGLCTSRPPPPAKDTCG